MTEMDPNTKEWYEHRLNGIGASDAPAIMGVSEYKTKLELWKEKVHRILETDEEREAKEFICNKGHTFEAWARPQLEFETGVSWKAAMFEHVNFPFLRATLDGWNPDLMEVWECKFMGKDKFDYLVNEKLSTRERIPPCYYDQLMQQAFVTGCKAIRLTGIIEVKDEYDNKQKVRYTFRFEIGEVERDYINSVLAPALFDFWKCVQEKIEPEPGLSDIVEVKDEKLIKYIGEYEELDKKKKDLDKEIKRVKANIERNKVHCKMDFEGIKLTEVAGRVSTDYAAAFNAFVSWIKNLRDNADTETLCMAVQSFPDEPNLKAYTKVGSPSFKITFPKKKKEVVGEKVIPGDLVKNNEDGTISKVEATEQLKNDLTSISPEVTEAATPAIERIEEIVNNDENEKFILEWKNPITGKSPKGWKTKGKEWQRDYLKKQLKKANEEQASDIRTIQGLLQ